MWALKSPMGLVMLFPFAFITVVFLPPGLEQAAGEIISTIPLLFDIEVALQVQHEALKGLAQVGTFPGIGMGLLDAAIELKR